MTSHGICALFVGAAFVACVHARGAGSTAQPGNDLPARGPFVVQTIEFPDLTDAARGRRVPIKVHLPTQGGPFPVVIVSHGAGGHWDANFAQAQHLASHGYVVLAVEHVGSNTEVLKRSFRLVANLEAMTRDANEVLGRPKDIGFAIDRAGQWNGTHERLRGRLDMAKIGVLGHSFGAYTTLVVAGMRPALDWLEPKVGPGHGLGPDLRDSRDSRVTCGVALSPQGPGEPFFVEASYASLRTPLLAISGSADRQQHARPENRRRAFQLWPPGDKYFLPSRSRGEVQPVVRAATLLFFDAYLKGDVSARQSLTATALRPYWRGGADGVEVLSK
jgi:predicted dienelactone hydrolase